MRLRRFTPQVSEIVNVVSTDRGRPLADLTRRLTYTTLTQDGRSVFRRLRLSHLGMNPTPLPNLPSGINVATAVSEAFDEPLTKAQVIAIVQGFFKPTLA